MVERARWLVMLPADVGRGHAGLAAQRRDDRLVDVVLGDGLGAHSRTACRTCSPVLRSSAGWLGRTACQASMACPTSGSTGLVKAVPVLCTGTSSRQTASSASDCRGESPGIGQAVVLPADAADPQPRDLVAAQPAEQPGQRDRPDQLHRVVGAGGVAGQIGLVQVQPGPQQLGPHLVGDHAGVGADQRRRRCAAGASARFGSNRRGIHSHSWQSRKNMRVAIRLCALVRGEIGLSAPVAEASRRWT